MQIPPAPSSASPSPSHKSQLSMTTSHTHLFGPGPISGITHRIFHPPKLERKHSSGDLHSRLKTRKILGVGETDNGDIHRSKISQLLGHNEHLYVKFPRGFWIWHLALAVLVTTQGLMALLLPHQFHVLILQQVLEGGDTNATSATRLSGAALLGMAIFVWSMQGTTEKAQARTSLAAITTHMLLQIIVNAVCVWQHGGITTSILGSLGMRSLIVLVSIFYHNAIGRSTAGLRKSSSYKDLTTPEKKDAASLSPKECENEKKDI